MASSNTLRQPGLDLLRVVGCCLVLVLHAAIPYVTHPMPGLLWPVHDRFTSPFVDQIFWSIEGCVMPLFFVMSGYFAAVGLQKRTPQQFVRQRLERLGLPLVLGCMVILPLDFIVWVIGWAKEGLVPLKAIRTVKLGPGFEEAWGLAHLWYLQYLLLIIAGYAAVIALWRKLTVGTPSPQLAGPVLRIAASSNPSLGRKYGLELTTIAILGLVIALLGIAPQVVLGFQHAFLPVIPKLVHATLFFALGVAIWGVGPIPQVTAWGVLAFGLWLLPWNYCVIANSLEHRSLAGSWEAASVMGLFACAISGGAVAVASQWRHQAGPLWTYLAEASFAIYLVHHPIVATFQIGVSEWQTTAEVKLIVTLIGTFACSLGLYETLIRKSVAGQLLTGSWSTRPKAAPAELKISKAA
jgi:glucans biosynthesis protein C